MKQKDRVSALEIALKNEMTERQFYLSNAERTSNPLGKAMFKERSEEHTSELQSPM